MNQRRRFAFTLIELLVVVAIIALLVTILMPTLNQAKRLTRETICATQVRSFTQVGLVIAVEHAGVLPTFSPANQQTPYWWSAAERDRLMGGARFEA